ncbi:MAG: bifunctional glutamate N-acetyltransferase/amino-acid acetyltransferase ArgJ [Polyangiaceae bacterium]|nr:bifunctional glutamate N-acetyltransferase/amino-acid acetyltransferase ArgJ [Polyangiaceae bacterium]
MRLPDPPTFAPCPITLTTLSGLRAAGVRAGIKASGNPDVGLLVADKPMPMAGVFTQNHFAAAPVLLSRKHLTLSGGMVRAMVVNSGNANACTGERGERDALQMAQRVAAHVGCSAHEVIVASTGVIGHKLPMDKVLAGIDACVSELSGEEEAGRNFLAAIQTTDAFSKEAGQAVALTGGGSTHVAGIAKGAGMIEPNMATMLAFVGTDGQATVDELNALIGQIARRSFNAVHVDSHTSTNDMFLLFATGKTGGSTQTWSDAAMSVARRLAWLIARDGEGATKVTTITVTGASSDEAANLIAREVAKSALVRTALFGNDPNWGRFVSQVGNSRHVKNVVNLTCTLQGVTVFKRGEPTQFNKVDLSKKMAVDDVSLELHIGEGDGRFELMTSDLGYKYVEVNAEYTT